MSWKALNFYYNCSIVVLVNFCHPCLAYYSRLKVTCMYMAAGCYILLHFDSIHAIQLDLLMVPTLTAACRAAHLFNTLRCVYAHAGYSRFHTCPDALQVLMTKSVRCL